MSLVTSNGGELRLLDKMLKLALSTDEKYLLRLYKTNVTPDDSSVASSFTEADFTNYAAVTLTRALWNSAVTVSNKAETSYGSAPQSWTCGASGNTVYGYYVTGTTNTTAVLWAELFSSARVLASGDILNIVPRFTLNKE